MGLCKKIFLCSQYTWQKSWVVFNGSCTHQRLVHMTSTHLWVKSLFGSNHIQWVMWGFFNSTQVWGQLSKMLVFIASCIIVFIQKDRCQREVENIPGHFSCRAMPFLIQSVQFAKIHWSKVSCEMGKDEFSKSAVRIEWKCVLEPLSKTAQVFNLDANVMLDC